MINSSFAINPQLRADSHPLFCWQQCHLRLHKNASLPWLIIIPETDDTEFHDLSTDVQLNVTHISRISSAYFKSKLGAEKINFAAIGNVVQQLHIHVIGRHRNDPLWPDVVWGTPLPAKAYSNAQLEKLSTDLLTLLEQQQ